MLIHVYLLLPCYHVTTGTSFGVLSHILAIKYDPNNMSLRWGRCDLYERIGDQKKAIEGYQQILDLLPKENGEKYFQLARDMAKKFHASSDVTKALVTMATAFKVHPTFVTAEGWLGFLVITEHWLFFSLTFFDFSYCCIVTLAICL